MALTLVLVFAYTFLVSALVLDVILPKPHVGKLRPKNPFIGPDKCCRCDCSVSDGGYYHIVTNQWTCAQCLALIQAIPLEERLKHAMITVSG